MDVSLLYGGVMRAEKSGLLRIVSHFHDSVKSAADILVVVKLFLTPAEQVRDLEPSCLP